jgi:hypothetical protein
VAYDCGRVGVVGVGGGGVQLFLIVGEVGVES